MTAKQKKKPTVSFIDGIALRTLKPGKLYSARVRMDPDVQFGGEHETWYWSKSRKIEAPSKAKALEKAERYRKELVDGAGGTDLTVAEFAREWQAGREEQSRASGDTPHRGALRQGEGTRPHAGRHRKGHSGDAS